MSWWMRFLLVLCVAIAGITLAPAQNKVIRPNDKVRVTCEEEPSLNRDYLVTADGLLVMSFIGVVKVSGLTEKEAATKIEDELVRQRILRKATVNVTLLTSEFLPVRFSGAVKNPGELIWVENMRLSDVAERAQPLGTADLEKVRIESRTGTISIVNFKRYEGRDMTFNPKIEAGDFVFFPLLTRSTEIFVLGAVRKPGAYELKPGMTVGKAVLAAGGLLATANPARVRFEREGTGKFINLLSAKDNDIELKAGDRIVAELVSKQNVVVVLGGVRTPGSLGFYDGLTLGKAIQACGGLLDGVKPGKVKVTRRDGNKTKTVTVEYNKIVEGFVADYKLQIGDTIEVAMPRGSRRNDTLLPALGILFFLLFG